MVNIGSTWELYYEGMQIDWKFAFSESDMKIFIDLSTDDSPIHTNYKFSQARGFKSPLLHGVLLSTQLSRLVGKELPDDRSMTVGFSIDFISPSYVNEELDFNAELSYKSEATKLIELKFRITRQKTVVAKGKVSAQWCGD